MTLDRSKRIAVFGCGGFIGSHLLERILSVTDYEVEGIDLSAGKIRHLLGHSRLHFSLTDINDFTKIKKTLERCEIIITLAALCNPYLYTHKPIDVIESNFVSIYPVIRACSDLGRRLIHFSTSEVYGRTLEGMAGRRLEVSGGERGFNENETPLLLGPIQAQRWCYASAKQLLERTVFAYGYERNLDYTIIRPFNFIGPRMDFIPGVDGEGVPRVLACFMDALLSGKPLLLVDGGRNRRCFTAIDDAIDAVMLIIERPKESSRRIFNIGNPENEITIANLAQRMISIYRSLCPDAAGSNYIVRAISSEEFYGKGYEDSDRRLPDIRAITEALGWKPKIGLDEALRKAIKGFVEEYGNRSTRHGNALCNQQNKEQL